MKYRFELDHYLGSNPDVAKAVAEGSYRSAWTHFVERGCLESREGVPLRMRKKVESVMAEAVAPTARFLARFPGSPDAATFERQARLEALDVYRAAAPYVHFDRPLSILDFGSGHGVLARLMAAISPLSAVRAVDFAGPEIEWCLDAYSDEIRWARMEVSVISGAPPLSFSSGCFDLVCGLTALARMGDAARLAWLAELRRITRPEGILVLGPLGDLLARHFDVLEDVPAASGSLDMVVCMRRTHPIV